jgi:hypothetical protein
LADDDDDDDAAADEADVIEGFFFSAAATSSSHSARLRLKYSSLHLREMMTPYTERYIHTNRLS